MPANPLDNFRSPTALMRFYLTAVLGVAADLLTKAWAVAELRHGRTPESWGEVRLIPGWLHFQYTENAGAVFGLGAGGRWLFVVVSFAAILFLTYLFATSGRNRFYQVLLGVLMAGVIGNLFDRLAYGYVRDMIYVLPHKTWPGTDRGLFPWIFNVADVLLCAGVGLMLAVMGRKPQPSSEPEAEAG